MGKTGYDINRIQEEVKLLKRVKESKMRGIK